MSLDGFDILSKHAARWDPVFGGLSLRGWTENLIVAGGEMVCRPAGGVNLYRGRTRAGIDRTAPCGAADGHQATVAPWPWAGQEPGDYWYELVASSPAGVEAVADSRDPQIVRVRVDDEGVAVSPLPPAVTALRVAAIAAGKFGLAWSYRSSRKQAAASVFRVYNDGGMGGGIDYGTVVATVTARLRPDGFYGFTSAAFSHGTTVAWSVRSRTAGGVEEESNVVRSAIADSEGPAAGVVADVSYGSDG